MTGKQFPSKFMSPLPVISDARYPVPRAADRTYILKNVLELCPDLVPPSVRASREPTIEDLKTLIVDEGCGLRPGRKGGIRLEVGSLERTGGGKIPVVYNYGLVFIVNLESMLTSILNVVMLEWDSSLHGDQRALRYSCWRTLFGL